MDASEPIVCSKRKLQVSYGRFITNTKINDSTSCWKEKRRRDDGVVFVSRSQRSHHHRKTQLDEHGQTEHQRPDRVGAQPRTHARLRLCTSAAVLRGDGALPEARLEKYAAPQRHLELSLKTDTWGRAVGVPHSARLIQTPVGGGVK